MRPHSFARPSTYVLIGHDPVPCADTLEWAAWYENADKQIAETKIGRVHISTIFLGIDYTFGGGNESPQLFETRVLGGSLDNAVLRTSTWERAEQAHQWHVLLVRESRTLRGRCLFAWRRAIGFCFVIGKQLARLAATGIAYIRKLGNSFHRQKSHSKST